MTIHDVTLPMRPGMVVYPGNPGFRFDPVSRKAAGASSNGSLVTMGTHTGTHVDAPVHLDDAGGGVETLNLDALVGRARIIRLDVTNRPVTADDLRAKDLTGVERLLIRTGNSEKWATATGFDEGFVGLAGDAGELIAERKIKLVGVDYLSVDKFRSGTHPAHHALIGAGVVILEGVNLSNIKEGDYDLFVGPLLIPGSDGAPARVFLIEA
jgi:arylformamidase